MNTQGTRWRGQLPIPERAHPLVRQLVGLLNKHKTTISEVAPRAGVATSTISAWRYRANPSLENFEAVLNVLDLELCIRPKSEAAE